VSETPEMPFWRTKNPIAWGAILTIALAALVATLAILPGPEGVKRYSEFSNLTSNEIGDTLAGIFAPLAFIWIVVTVFLQSLELAEQRKELALTRTELQLAREAQEAQLGVMQKQAEIFEDEKKQRAWDRVEKVLDGLLVNLARKCELLNDATNWEFDFHEDDYSGMTDEDFMITKDIRKETTKPFATVPSSNLDERVHQHARTLMAFYLFLLHKDRHLRCSKKVNRKYFAGMDELFEQILEQAKEASKGQKVRIAALNLESMREHLSEIMKLDLWLPESSVSELP
jgi:hypothetical protein